MYFDPDAWDPLEAQKATLPLDVQRRMFAIDLAAKLVSTLRRPAAPGEIDDLFATLLDTAHEIEEHLVREERRWDLANMPYSE